MNERLRSPAVLGGAAVAAVVLIVLVVAMCSGGDEPADTTVAAAQTTTTVLSSTTSAAPTTTAFPTTTTAAGITTTSPGAGPTAAPTTTTAPTTTSPGAPPTTAPPTTIPPPSTTYPPSERPDGPFVRIGDDYFSFTPTECLIYEGLDAYITGPGEAPDGSPVYVALEISTLRIDIGTQDPMEEMDDHWAAGDDYGGELVVEINNWLVTADAVLVHGPTSRGADAELEVECSF